MLEPMSYGFTGVLAILLAMLPVVFLTVEDESAILSEKLSSGLNYDAELRRPRPGPANEQEAQKREGLLHG